jgi:hypothetical protein
MHKILAALLLPVALNGCAVAAGAALGAGVKKTMRERSSTQEAAAGRRATFTADFNKNNTEREKAGLQPLSWCDELYKFDQSWYAEDAKCNAAAEKANTTDKT